MRAVTGTILSSRPCPVAKVPRVLALFLKETPAGLISSDAATYLRTAIEASDELNLFRRDLRRRQQLEVGGESERRHRHAPVEEEGRWEPKVEEEDDGRWEPKAEEEEEHGRWEPKAEEDIMTVPAAGEKKSRKKKGSREDEEPSEEKRDIAAPHGDLQSPASEKRRKKKERHVKQEIETEHAMEEQSRKALGDALQGMASEEGIESGKKVKKKKKHIKQEEEEVVGAKEAEQKSVHVGVAENGLASEEKKRKKKKHAEVEEVKQEVVDDGGGLGSDKKRKKKRCRDGDNGNDTELVEHTKKKQRK